MPNAKLVLTTAASNSLTVFIVAIFDQLLWITERKWDYKIVILPISNNDGFRCFNGPPGRFHPLFLD